VRENQGFLIPNRSSNGNLLINSHRKLFFQDDFGRFSRLILNLAAPLFPPIVQVQETDRMAQKHEGKIALITGAKKGIGYEVARQLGKEGITVLNGARNPQLGGAAEAKLKAEGADAHFVELDVTRPETITKAAERIRAQHGRLDILINNAGVVDKGDGPPSVADPDAARRVLDVNFFGVLSVTQAMLPLVRKAASGRIVMVSSGLGSLTWNADPTWPFAGIKPLGYNGSKAILNMLTVQLAWDLAGHSDQGQHRQSWLYGY
jgi:NAD(P)-dependent dehydrogenase (short-subunit alcohol dehydrogenase family)